MKKLNQYAGLLGLLIFLTGCSATNRLTMNATEPAPVFLSREIQKVAVVNRSMASEKHEGIDKIDRILSAEGMQLDRKGADAAVSELLHELSADDRFSEVVMVDSLSLERKGLGVFPATLDWDYVRELCDTYEADVLFVLEYYDTDTRAAYRMTTRALPNNLGINVNVPYHEVTLNTLVKNGWRIYDPYGKMVLDEFSSQRQISTVGEGINPIKAVEAVMGREAAVIEQSKYLGNQYAWRIRPVTKRIARDYFVRGTEKFEIAKRRAQTGDWEGAAQLWEQELLHPSRKIAGRANYNMAIISEINGDLEKAIEWASRSYTDYRNKEALRYMDLLNYRVAEQAELERQLSR